MKKFLLSLLFLIIPFLFSTTNARAADTGNLRLRIQEFNNDGSRAGFINGVTVKLTNASGSTVLKTTTSSTRQNNNEPGWVAFDDLQPGTYGIMAYKTGMTGVWKEVDCDPAHATFQNATIQNEHTEGLVAAWDNNAVVEANKTTFCHDLGLKDSSLANKGNLRFRIQEMYPNGSRKGFLNGATVKLTDTQGNTVFQTATSGTKGSEEGWIHFDNLPEGTYGILAYKQGMEGLWKEVDCDPTHATTQNATIENTNTEGLVAAFDNNAPVVAGQTTFCHDLGLAIPPAKYGSVKLYTLTDGDNNGATVKLTDTNGETVIATTTTRCQYYVGARCANAGYAEFLNIPVGTYGVMAYKDNYEGQGSTINNSQTEGHVAAWNNNVIVTSEGSTFAFSLNLGLVRVRVSTEPQTAAPGEVITVSWDRILHPKDDFLFRLRLYENLQTRIGSAIDEFYLATCSQNQGGIPPSSGSCKYRIPANLETHTYGFELVRRSEYDSFYSSYVYYGISNELQVKPNLCATRLITRQPLQETSDGFVAGYTVGTSEQLPNNYLHSLYFTVLSNAKVFVNDQEYSAGQTANFSEGTRNATFTASRIDPSQGLTVQLMVRDDCNDFPDFEGIGH